MRRALIGIVVLAATVGLVHADTFDWANAGNPCLDRNGDAIPDHGTDPSFEVHMWNATQGAEVGLMEEFYADGYFGSFGHGDFKGGAGPYTIAAGDEVYTYIVEDLGGGQYWYADLDDSSKFTVPGAWFDSDEPPNDFQFGYYPTENTEAGDWILVPEPGTLALFALGAVVMAAARARLRS